MDGSRGRSIEEKQSLKHSGPAAPEYSNINEARENSFFVLLFSIYMYLYPLLLDQYLVSLFYHISFIGRAFLVDR